MFGLSDVTFFKVHIRLTITTPRSGCQPNCSLEKVLAKLIHAEGHSRKTCACNLSTTMSLVFKLDSVFYHCFKTKTQAFFHVKVTLLIENDIAE